MIDYIIFLQGTFLLILLAAGNTKAILQDSGTISYSTKNLSQSLSPETPSKHAIHHFTLYRKWQGNRHTGVDNLKPPINTTSKYQNHVKPDVHENITPFSYDRCTITVNDEGVKVSGNCSCGKYQNESSRLDSALNCAKNKMNTAILKINLASERLLLFQTHNFMGSSGIHFTGMPTLIVCNNSRNSGLKFWNSTNITFEKVTLSSCGAGYQSTSVNFINRSMKITSLSAIYLSHCSDLAFINVNITQSEGLGLALVNCGGTVHINESHFIKNAINKKDITTPGGGGVSIELVEKCTLSECNSFTVGYNSYTMYYITKSTFLGNVASSGEFYITHIVSGLDYFTYGQGGGLSVHFGSDSQSNRVVIKDCHFECNHAQRGGGLFVSFREYAISNTISIERSSFHKNSCYRAKLPPGGNYSSGGGLMALFYTNSMKNSFSIRSSNITHNSAYFGGGLSLGGATDYNNGTVSKFSISRCVFDHNKARIGAALDLYYRISVKETNHGSSLFPSISDSNFTHNGGFYEFSTENATGRTFATIYIVYIPTRFSGIIVVNKNMASGFGIEAATIQIMENAVVQVTKNTAKIGGGMAMIGRSTVVLRENTHLIFINNTATEKGGAIFSSQSQERYTAYDFTCFIQYTNYSCPPADWKSNLVFFNNKAGNNTRNDIYVSSLLPCVWPKNATSELNEDIKETFCGWNNSWHFKNAVEIDNCTNLIETAPSRFSNTSYSVSVIPGDLTPIKNFKVLDDLGHDVSSSALYTISEIMSLPRQFEKIYKKFQITVTNEGILVKASKKRQLRIVLQTADRKSVSTQINVTILDCPPGYMLRKQVCKCVYNFQGKIDCHDDYSDNFTSGIFAGYCITFSRIELPNNNISDRKLIVARCPYVVGQLTSLYTQLLPYHTYGPETEDVFCRQFKRTGRLCGWCMKGLGLDVYSTNFRCIVCNDTYTVSMNWIKVIAASTLPTTLLFILCTVFHISITSARMNGYIFFSHVISMRLDILTVQYAWKISGQNTHTLSNLLYVPYQLWNFNFPRILLYDICLGQEFKVIHALALQYLSVLYPLLLVFIAIILIELHAKNFKLLVWLWKPLCYVCVRFRHSWHIRTSVIDTFASFLLLSYSYLIGVSMTLLARNSIIIDNNTVVGHTLNYDTSVPFFGGEHLKFGALAIIILSTFGAIPPILLILYPFKWFQYLLNKCNLKGRRFLQVFVDAFQGSYKNNVKGYPERRYFAGVYFLFRIAINVIYMAVEDMVKLHLTLTLTYISFTLIILAQRPYKKNFYNILDGSFMGLLVFIHALTMYLLHHALAFRHIPQKVWYFTYTIQHIPTLYMILLVVYLVSFRMRCVKRFFCNHFGGKVMFFKNEGFDTEKNSPLMNHDWPSSASLVIPSPLSPYGQSKNLSDIPDRVDNPQRYEPLVDSWQFSSRRSDHDFIEAESKSKSTKYGSIY